MQTGVKECRIFLTRFTPRVKGNSESSPGIRAGVHHFLERIFVNIADTGFDFSR